MSEPRIPFNRTFVAGREVEYLREALASGHLSGDGPFTARAERLVSAAAGGGRTFLTGSCTQALEMSALLLDLAPGDEVIVPAFTFVSTANAFATRGGRPVFADSEAESPNIDPAHVARLITPRTRAICVVNYAGVACDLDAFTTLAREHDLPLIEDNAHGLFARYRGQPLGSFGALATQSFHETKNVTCGEGGALIVNDPALVPRAEILRHKGTNRARFLQGQVDKYTWVDLGSNFMASELQAAHLCAQLEAADRIQAMRQEIWRRYHEALRGWAARHDVRTPVVPAWSEHPAHCYYLVMPTAESRQRLIAHLGDRGILAVFHYQALNVSDMGQRYGGRPGDCPRAEALSGRLVRLPLFAGMTSGDVDRVIDAVLGVRP